MAGGLVLPPFLFLGCALFRQGRQLFAGQDLAAGYDGPAGVAKVRNAAAPAFALQLTVAFGTVVVGHEGSSLCRHQNYL